MVGRYRVLIAVAVGWVGCGDDPPRGPRPLVEDPALQVGCAPGPIAGARAKVVACAEELIGGRLASGRIGDVVLENERLRVIVRGAGAGYYLHGSSGGGIVDAAVVGGEDLIKEVLPVVDLTAGAFDELVIVEAGDDGAAELVVRGPAAALDIVTAAIGREVPSIIVEHHYRLAAGADAVELETHVFTMPGAEVVSHDVYDALFMGGRATAFQPGRGWAMGQGAAELLATAGTTSSYGVVYPAGSPDPQLIDLGGIRILLGPTITEASASRWLVLGDGSVSSVTGRAWALRGVPLGVVRGTSAPGVEVWFRDGVRGAPITIARADAAGGFAAAVPAGAYTLRAESAGRTPGPDVAVSVAAGGEVSATVPAGPGGTLAVSVRDDTGAAVPARVLSEQAGGDQRIDWVGASGEATVALPPGTWRISVSRGLEYDAFVASAVTIADGQATPVAVTLTRVVDTAGWISLDTHLHSELSTDSTFPVDDRLRAVAAEGVEVPVSSDHDLIVDYAPIIADLGLHDWLGSLTGSETSSLVWGHVNAWPLAVDDTRSGGGSPRWLGRAPGEIFAALHGGAGSRIVQVNHPRLSSDSLFDAIDLDPRTLTAGADPTDLGLPANADLSDLSFDAVEVANALSDGDFEEVFADWLALVGAGHPAAATGSSDSHGPSGFAGEARTYVWVGSGADDPATVSDDAIVDAIRARHVVVGTGAFVTAGIVTGAGTSLPGDTVDVGAQAPITIRIRVQAPPWQPLARVRIFEGTREARVITLDPADTATIRYDADVVMPAPPADTFYVVRVDAGGRGDPVLGTPMPAFTNPLLVRVAP